MRRPSDNNAVDAEAAPAVCEEDAAPQLEKREIPKESWRNRRRRLHKSSAGRGGFFHTCRVARAAVFLTASLLCPTFGAAEGIAHNFSEGARALCQKLHGTTRPDILEVYGGEAEVFSIPMERCARARWSFQHHKIAKY